MGCAGGGMGGCEVGCVGGRVGGCEVGCACGRRGGGGERDTSCGEWSTEGGGCGDAVECFDAALLPTVISVGCSDHMLILL